LLVCIVFQIAMLLFTPMLMQMLGDAVKQIQAKADQQRKDQLEALKQEAAQAKTAEEKSQIEQRQGALKVTPQVAMPDMSKMADMMKTPAFQATWPC
jgi:Sec-independent protein translocase protein TatA